MPPLLLTIYLKIEQICFRVFYLLAKIKEKKWSSFSTSAPLVSLLEVFGDGSHMKILTFLAQYIILSFSIKEKTILHIIKVDGMIK